MILIGFDGYGCCAGAALGRKTRSDAGTNIQAKRLICPSSADRSGSSRLGLPADCMNGEWEHKPKLASRGGNRCRIRSRKLFVCLPNGLFNNRLGGVVPILAAAAPADANRDRDPTVDISFVRPLAKCHLLLPRDDRTASAKVAALHLIVGHCFPVPSAPACFARLCCRDV